MPQAGNLGKRRRRRPDPLAVAARPQEKETSRSRSSGGGYIMENPDAETTGDWPTLSMARKLQAGQMRSGAVRSEKTRDEKRPLKGLIQGNQCGRNPGRGIMKYVCLGGCAWEPRVRSGEEVNEMPAGDRCRHSNSV